MSRGRLVVHGHFYQPPRSTRSAALMPLDPTAAPAHDWNAAHRPPTATARTPSSATRPRCRGTSGRRWPAGWRPATRYAYRRGFVDGDARARQRDGPAVPPRDPAARVGGRPAHRDPLGHARLRAPLRAATGRDVAARDGRRHRHAAVAADEGIRYTILAPWQAAGRTSTHGVRTGSSWAADGARWSRLYDAGLSTAVSFEPEATADADRFARERIAPRPRGRRPAARRAARRDRHRRRAVRPSPAVPRAVPRAARRSAPSRPDRPFDVVDPRGGARADAGRRPFRPGGSTSGRRGAATTASLRWSGECAASPDGSLEGAAARGARAAGRRRSTASTDRARPARCRASPTRGRPATPTSMSSSAREPSGAFAARWLGARRRSRPPHAAATHGGPALAARDVRELRLVLGRPDAPGDAAASCARGPRGAAGRRARGHGPGAASDRGSDPLELAPQRDGRRGDATSSRSRTWGSRLPPPPTRQEQASA